MQGTILAVVVLIIGVVLDSYLTAGLSKNWVRQVVLICEWGPYCSVLYFVLVLSVLWNICHHACCLCEINLSKVLFVLIFQFERDLLVNQFDLCVACWTTCDRSNDLYTDFLC
jgi:hypothetical protein